MAHNRPAIVTPTPDVVTRPGRNVRAAPAPVFFAVTLAYTAVVHFTTPVYPQDDAFIIYRYVDNLMAGTGTCPASVAPSPRPPSA